MNNKHRRISHILLAVLAVYDIFSLIISFSIYLPWISSVFLPLFNAATVFVLPQFVAMPLIGILTAALAATKPEAERSREDFFSAMMLIGVQFIVNIAIASLPIMIIFDKAVLIAVFALLSLIFSVGCHILTLFVFRKIKSNAKE